MRRILVLTCSLLMLCITSLKASSNLAPAQRIISLSPHTTELLYSAGAGDKIIAVDADSNYPSQALLLPRVATHASINIEQIVILKPDLIVDGDGYHLQAVLQQLDTLRVPFHQVQTTSLAGVAESIQILGQLAGTTVIADSAANNFTEKLQQLKTRYSGNTPIPVFFQIWFDPLMTIGSSSFVNDAMELCGGRNIYANTAGAFPQISIESLLIENPRLIVAYGNDAQIISQLQTEWKQHASLSAVKNNNYLVIPHALLATPGPRVLEGVEMLCQKIASIHK